MISSLSSAQCFDIAEMSYHLWHVEALQGPARSVPPHVEMTQRVGGWLHMHWWLVWHSRREKRHATHLTRIVYNFGLHEKGLVDLIVLDSRRG